MGLRSVQPEKSSSTSSERHLFMDLALWMEAGGVGEGGREKGVALSHRDEEGSPTNCFHRGWTKVSERSVRAGRKENPLERSALNSYVIRIQKEFMSSWYKKKKHFRGRWLRANRFSWGDPRKLAARYLHLHLTNAGSVGWTAS